MKKIGNYKNGNYMVTIMDDGTKIRFNNEDCFIAEKPECMDVKITNYCDMGCPMCHEKSTIEGKHGDILNQKFIDTLLPYTELAIGGGNPLSHRDLLKFLTELKSKNIIANMTVNQKHFMENINYIKNLTDNKLIYGLGVSLTSVTDEFIDNIKMFPNAVIHIINGIVNYDDLKKLYNKDLKILILGYKNFGRGKDYYNAKIEEKKKLIYDNLQEIIDNFKVVSFDNLALKQLEVKRLMSEEQWNEFYMGDDGSFTMYIDLVEKKFARCSVAEIRYDLKDDIKDMFSVIKGEE